MSRELTDTQKFWLDLRNAGTKGIHSWEPRYSKNISQRAKDCTSKGQQVWKRVERRNGRPGTRFWLDGNQPDDATAVRPNGTEGGGGTATSDAGDSPAIPLSVEAADEQVGVKEPVALFRDYTDPNGEWREVPISELGWAA